MASNSSDAARWEALDRRIAQLERLLATQTVVESRGYAIAVTYSPPVFRLCRQDGELRSQRYPKVWSDLPVREMVIRLHRQMPLEQAVEVISAEFGPERAPSRSALGRIWKHLDQTRGVGA